MNLLEALRRQKEEFVQQAPQEVLATMGQATQNLVQSGIVEKCLQPGDKAPEFSLASFDGSIFHLSSELAKGPVVVKFFRGGW